MTPRSRRQFQSLYDAQHPVLCERCWRPWEPWLVPAGIGAEWVELEPFMWRRVA